MYALLPFTAEAFFKSNYTYKIKRCAPKRDTPKNASLLLRHKTKPHEKRYELTETHFYQSVPFFVHYKVLVAYILYHFYLKNATEFAK